MQADLAHFTLGIGKFKMSVSIIIKRSSSIDMPINDFVNNIFKGISTTPFY